MPRKLTTIGVLGALVLGIFGLTNAWASGPGPFAIPDSQSFCTVGHNAAGTCPAGFSPVDWDICYDTGGGVAPPTPGNTCGAGSSDSTIPAALGGGAPIKSWQIISIPIGSRLTLPVTYTPASFGVAVVPPPPPPGSGHLAGATTTGDVTAFIDVLCDASGATNLDILARNGTPADGWDPDLNPSPGAIASWPTGWDPFNFRRDTVTDPQYAYIDQIKPMPFPSNSIDVARLTRLWLGNVPAGTPLPIAPTTLDGVTDTDIQGTPLVNLDTTYSYPATLGLHASVAILAGNPNPPNNQYLCLDSPQNSVSTNLETLPPQANGGYVRWTNLQSAADFVSGQVTRIMIARCLVVGTGVGAGTCQGGANMGDGDSDGVPDAVEDVLGTDKTKVDTDGDLSSDFQETFEFTDPGCAVGGNICGAGHPADTRDTDGDGSFDLHDDLSGLACGANGGSAVTGVCNVHQGCTGAGVPFADCTGSNTGTAGNNGDLPASGAGSDDNCPIDANPGQENTDSRFDFTNSPNTPALAIYRGDSTNPHQDRLGDACDIDMDNDGMDNVVEVGSAQCIADGKAIIAAHPGLVGDHDLTATGTGYVAPNGTIGGGPGYVSVGGPAASDPPILITDNCGFNHTNVAPGCTGAGVPVAGCPAAGPAAGTLWCLANGASTPSGGMNRVETDPKNSDTDSDLGLDGRECQFGSDPISTGLTSCNPNCPSSPISRFPVAGAGADPDADGLFPAGAELLYHTSHINQGTGAALDDLEQSQMGGPLTPGGTNNYNCNPLTPLAPCKPIPDGTTGPNDPDADGDLLLDGWEVKFYDTSPANFDSDGDGCSDGREAADVNGDHKVDSGDTTAIGVKASLSGEFPAAPFYPPNYNAGNPSAVIRDEVSTYDIDKNGQIVANDKTTAAKLTGNCKFQTGTNRAQGSTPIDIGTKP